MWASPGPVVGFLFAIPALAIAVLYSKVVPFSEAHASIVFGQPLALRLLAAILRPGVPPGDLLLHPVGPAAWVGLFATALNLLPGGQLDGGHILYAAASKYHRRITIGVALLLDSSRIFFWRGWILWSDPACWRSASVIRHCSTAGNSSIARACSGPASLS